MSAIGGIFNLDRSPVDEAKLIAQGIELDARGPDGGRLCKAGPVGMVHRAFHTNRESRLENQPLVSSRGHILCWNGRLDNRQELIAILRPSLEGNSTDVTIVMAAYMKWGLDFLQYITGDFAMSLWDNSEKMLLLARDPIGSRTLFYYHNDKRIIWSTELRLILNLASILLEINDEYVAGYLANIPEPGITPYKNIESVRPAHLLVFTSARMQDHAFWSPDPKRETRYKKDAEYEEHFRYLFRDAIRCRLRADVPVWAELSGGLDSTSVVCVASDIIKCGEAQAPSLYTVSRVFDEASKSDERKFIYAVEKKIGKAGVHLREDDFRILAPLKNECLPTLPSYITNFAALYQALDEALRSTGSRVVLTGVGGDEVLLGSGAPFPELADLLIQGDLLKLHRRMQVWSRALNEHYFRCSWQRLIVPLLPQRLQTSYNHHTNRIIKLFNQKFVRRMHLRERMFEPFDLMTFGRPSDRYRLISFLWAPRQISVGYWQEVSEAEFSYPFTHRPLVEFMLGIPVEQTIRPNESKSILRRALGNFLPTEVRNRKGRITNMDAMIRATVREQAFIRETFKTRRSSIGEYLDSKAILEAFDRPGKSLKVYILSLLPFVHWLESLELRRSIAGSQVSASAGDLSLTLHAGVPAI